MRTLKRWAASSAFGVWLVASIVFVVKVLFVVQTPMRGIASTTWLLDDSFIEMRVARNIALGHGFSLDGIHPTTGAPFLWMYVSALNHLLPTKDAAIRATLLQSALYGALAAVVVFYLARKLTQDRHIAWTAFLLSTFTANAFFNALNGMETSFYTLFVLLAIAAYLGVGKPAHWSPLAWGSAVGLLAGITAMTRGDGLFLIFALTCMKLYEWWRSPVRERRGHALGLLGMLLTAGICFSFFMGWQLHQTGSPFPGNQVGRRELAIALQGFSFDHFTWARYSKIVVFYFFQLEDILTIATGSSLLMLTAFVSGSLQKRFRTLSIISAIYLGIFFTLLFTYQWYFADFHGLRYVNPAAHIFFIYAAFLVWNLPGEYWRRSAAIFLTVATIVLAGYRHYQLTSRARWAPYMSYIGQPDPEMNRKFWATIDWINAHLSPDTVIGVRDYGRISMFADVRIQDIAGNIDPEAPNAFKNGTLDQYLKQRNVQYLLIPTVEQRGDALYRYLHSKLSLELVKDAPQSPPAQNLYRIVW